MRENYAHRAGASLPESCTLTAAQALEGEDYARAWLARMEAGKAQPGELSVIFVFLAGEMLHGACRVIERALVGAKHG